MLKTAGVNVFRDRDCMVLDVWVGTESDSLCYARKSISIGEWDLMGKMDVLDIVHAHLQALREVA
jgi:hypothetical protein